MIKIEKLKEQATHSEQAEAILQALKKMKSRDPQEALTTLKEIFFSPQTHPQVRYALATLLGQSGNQQVFNQVLSYFILRTFSDQHALIRALKGFAQPESVRSLTQYYKSKASFEERLEIIDTLAAIQTPDTVEFLSRIHNGQINYQEPVESPNLATLRERASSALSKQIMRFD